MRFVLIALVLVAGCKKSREKQCDELASAALAVVDGLAKGLGGKGGPASADPEIKEKMKEFKAQCMAWPEEVFECMQKNDETSPQCIAAMEKVTGVTAADASKAPAGPPVAASAKLGDPGWDGLRVSLLADGTLIAAPKGSIVAVAPTGKQKWRVELDHGPWFLVDGTNVLAGDRETHELVSIDQAGAVAWRAEVPKGADEYSERGTEGAVSVGGKIYVAIADGRFLRVDTAACAKQAKPCLETAFTMTDESFDDPALLAIGNDLLVGESDAIRRITTTGKVTAHLAVRDSFGGVAITTGDRIAAVMDDELVLFDLAKCSGGKYVLPRKSGRMYMKGDGECEDCATPPVGCLAKRTELSDVESGTPTVLRDGSVVVTNFDGPALVGPNGVKKWATEIDAVGVIREVGDSLVFVSRGDDKAPARVVALSTETGKVKWATPLPQIESSAISYTFEPIVELNGKWLVAGAKGDVSWIAIK